MRGKAIFAVVILIIALLLAILGSTLPQDKLTSVIYFTRFFDIMIPVLAVGALIKYLFTCSRCRSCETKTTTIDNR